MRKFPLVEAGYAGFVIVLAFWAAYVWASVVLPFPRHAPHPALPPGTFQVDDFNHQVELLHQHTPVDVLVFAVTGAFVAFYLMRRIGPALVWSLMVNPLTLGLVYLLHLFTTARLAPFPYDMPAWQVPYFSLCASASVMALATSVKRTYIACECA